MFTTLFGVEWGDCDEAGIVYYPRYFYWMDCAFHRFLLARGLSYRQAEYQAADEPAATQAAGHVHTPSERWTSQALERGENPSAATGSALSAHGM